MSSKYPYGIKVRILGDDSSGYRVQYTYNYCRFLPFFTIWFDHEPWQPGVGIVSIFDTFEKARVAAMARYDDLYDYEKDRAERKKKLKNAKKVVWEYP